MRENLKKPDVLVKVADEIVRQIMRFKALGLEFQHLDGHRHFHALPELFGLVVEVSAANGLKSIRLTKDWILPRTPSCFWDASFFRHSIDLLGRHGIVYRSEERR